MSEDPKLKVDSKHFDLFYFLSFQSKRAKKIKPSCIEKIFWDFDYLKHIYFAYSGIQDSLLYYLVSLAHRIGEFLFNSNDHLDEKRLKELYEFFQTKPFLIIPGLEILTPYLKDISYIIEEFYSAPDLRQQLGKIHAPFLERKAREILFISNSHLEDISINDALTRQSVFTALLTPLRQSVGSCFATAPCLLIQKNQIKQMLQDLCNLISTERLKRVREGRELEVPLSPSWGVGDLQKPIFISEGEKPWFSPGLISSLEKVGLLNKQNTFKQNVLVMREKILKLGKQTYLENENYTNPEKLLMSIIREELSLKKEQLMQLDQEQQKQNLLPNESLALLAGEKKIGKRNLEQQAFHLYIAAKEAFKLNVENPLLKSWEFSVASFSEAKFEFAQWNMFHALGIDSKEAGGIGGIIYVCLETVLAQAQRIHEEERADYDRIFTEAKGVESRINRASSQEDYRWLKGKYNTVLAELGAKEERLENLKRNADRLSQFFPLLVKKYQTLFPLYFQEIYDADMKDVKASLYDDRPAGYRLLYKQGRQSSHLWTRISNPDEYIEALISFFTLTEHDVCCHEEFLGLENIIKTIINEIILQIRNEDFLISSLYRMNKAHTGKSYGNLLENLDRLEKKPWAYTSGGSMEQLVSNYFALEKLPTQIKKEIKDAEHLYVFILETLRELEGQLIKNKKGVYQSLLMYSPTHAFLVDPEFFKIEIQEKKYAYSYLAEYKQKCMSYIKAHPYNRAYAFYLSHKLAQEVSIFQNKQGVLEQTLTFCHTWKEARDKLIALIKGGGVQIAERIDAFLLRHISLLPVQEVKGFLQRVLQKKFPQDQDRVTSIVSKIMGYGFKFHYLSEKELVQLVRLSLLELINDFSVRSDLNSEFMLILEEEKLIYPLSKKIADTNWAHYYFSITFNPLTEELELWRSDYFGFSGVPMHSWKKYLGSSKGSVWGIFSKPSEYFSSHF